jgi:hypothetical protein
MTGSGSSSVIRDRSPSVWAWGKEFARPSDLSFYQSGKSMQWDIDDIDWSCATELHSAVGSHLSRTSEGTRQRLGDLLGPPMNQWKTETWISFETELLAWRLSQFLHGEQLALVCAAKVVRGSSDLSVKLEASIQVADEGRHVQAFSRYLASCGAEIYDVEPGLSDLITLVVNDSEWDVACMLMQVVLEASALEAYRTLSALPDPLLRAVLKRVMADEKRHIASAKTLVPLWEQLSAHERRARQDEVVHAVRAVRAHLRPEAVCDRFELRSGRYQRIISFIERGNPQSLSRRIERNLGRHLVSLRLLEPGETDGFVQRLRSL